MRWFLSLPAWLRMMVPVLVGLWLFLRFFEWKSLYYPARRIEATPATFQVSYEEVEFLAEDGVALHGWWVPHPQARGVVLYCHGNAGNISSLAPAAVPFHDMGLNVFFFDYRGYGKSRGFPTEKGTYRDARAAYEVVRARYQDAETPPVIVHGHSLGAAVAARLALEKPVRGLVLDGAFPSVADMAAHIYPGLPLRWLLWFKYDTRACLAQQKVPKLFFHCPADSIVPYEMGRALYDAAAEPKQFIDLPGDHNDMDWLWNGPLRQAYEHFIAKCLAGD